jgi:hypothetical protein
VYLVVILSRAAPEEITTKYTKHTKREHRQCSRE